MNTSPLEAGPYLSGSRFALVQCVVVPSPVPARTVSEVPRSGKALDFAELYDVVS